MVNALLLLTIPALADGAIPFMVLVAPAMVILLIPVVAIESYGLRRALGLSTGGCLKVSAIANLGSAAVAIPFAIALGNAFPDSFANWFLYHISAWTERMVIAALLVPFFFASWWIEYFIARWLLKGERPAGQVHRAMGQVNLASYLFLLFFLIARDPRSLQPTYSSNAVGALRTINTAEITYASTYGRGFAPTLAALGPPAGNAQTSAAAADLIDDVLAHGEKRGYTYAYRPGPRDAKGEITTYTVSARPLKYGEPNARSYFTDESGVIRQTTDDRPATAQDPPV
jgi:hypothetical protein